MRLEQLEDIEAGTFGASALQKEAMRISKIDTLHIEIKRVTDENPLSTVEVLIESIFLDNSVPREPGKPLPLEQGEISQGIVALFKGKFLNRGECFPLQLCEGKLVIKVVVNFIESLKMGNPQTFGIVDENTIFRFKVGQKSQASIKVNSNEAKQIFKADISFNELGIGGLDE